MTDILKELSETQVLIMIKSANLRKKYESILIMRYVYNKSCSEIADELGKEVFDKMLQYDITTGKMTVIDKK